MARVSAANGGDTPCVAGYCEPVVNGRTDAPALDRRLPRPMVPGYQQNDPLARLLGAFKGHVDGVPRAVQIETVKVDDPVRLD